MTDSNDDLKARLEQARELVSYLEAGDRTRADALLTRLSRAHDGTLFQELGRITRELHEAINGFLLDDRVLRLAQEEIPDAAERLRYVITMTEQSANTTLTAVEAGMPVLEVLQQRASHLAAEWQRFRNRELAVEDFRRLTEDLSAFLGQVGHDSGHVQGCLSEVLMAQGFQDLTGQIIRKVIRLVQDVEEKLVNLVRLSGGGLSKVDLLAMERDLPPAHSGEGPAVPGLDVQGVVKGQDEVDDLLSSLGF